MVTPFFILIKICFRKLQVSLYISQGIKENRKFLRENDVSACRVGTLKFCPGMVLSVQAFACIQNKRHFNIV